MSLIPAFQVGVCNAWILMLLVTLLMILPFVVPSLRKEVLKRMATGTPFNKAEKILDNFSTALFVLAFIYSIFLPLKLGTVWFYTGLPVFLIGCIIQWTAFVKWQATPLDVPITVGPYRYSRHPMYLSWFIQFLGVGLAAASWLFLLLMVVYITILNILAAPEERFCLEKYGDAYRDYLNRTPRWLGIPKSGKGG